MGKGEVFEFEFNSLYFSFFGELGLLSEKVAVTGVFRAGSLVFGVLKSKFIFLKKEGKRCAFIV